MKKELKKLLTVLMAITMLLGGFSSLSAVAAVDNTPTEILSSETIDNSTETADIEVLPELEDVDLSSEELPILPTSTGLESNEEVASLSQPIEPAAAGDTIAQTFPDPILAQAIADKLTGGNVNAVFHAPGAGIVDTSYHNFHLEGLGIKDATGIELLVNAREIYLRNNNLTTLPENIGDIQSLNILDVSYNKLTSLPESFGSLKAWFIDLRNNQLTSLPENIGQDGKLGYFLTELHLESNQLTRLPESMGKMKRLNTLWLDRNQLTSLPESIGGMELLVVLYASNNKITSLPESFCNLKVEQVHMENNQLARLPENFGNMSNLGYLNLKNNQLTSLPTSFSQLKPLWQNPYLNYYFKGNLLPSNFNDTVSALKFGFTGSNEVQRQLTINTELTPFEIRTGSDFNNIDLFSTVKLSDGSAVASSQQLVLENYVDENNDPVDINEYLKNGIVQKQGKVFAQIRAAGIGVFPNNSANAITVDTIELNFVLNNLSFDLNGATGTAPVAQLIVEGETGTPVANPTREGYSFKSWNTAQDGSGATWTPGSTPMPANDVILYAQWEKSAEVIVTPSKTGKSTATLPKTGEQIITVGALFLGLFGSLIFIIGKKRNKQQK